MAIKYYQFDDSNMASVIVAEGAFLKYEQCNFIRNNAVDVGATLLNVGAVLYFEERRIVD